MAFPWIFQSNFEAGTVGEWDSETDTGSQLDVAHYSELARFPWPTAAPLSGAYCLRLRLTGGTADAVVTEGDLNVAADALSWFGFGIWFSPNFTATANDTVNLLELQETGNAAMATFGFRVVSATGVINLGIGKAAPTTFSSAALERGVWYWVDLRVELDDGGTNDGTIDLYVTRVGDPAATTVHATQVATLDQTAVTHGVLGAQDHLATTKGVILIDDFIQDDLRVYPPTSRYPYEVMLTKSGHAFVGTGTITNVTLLSGAGTDNVLKVFDTDIADTLNAESVLVELKNTANNETVDPAGMPIQVRRGAYVQLSGTNPRALVSIGAGARSDARVRRI